MCLRLLRKHSRLTLQLHSYRIGIRAIAHSAPLTSDITLARLGLRWGASMLELDILLTEAKMAEGFREALARRYLPEKFFYWFPLSVKAWLDLCQDSRPYRNYSRSYELVSKYAVDIAQELEGSKVAVVSLGAGQGDKDALILQALRAHGIEASYRPVDSSESLLEIALARAMEAGFRARGLKADVEDPKTFEILAAIQELPRLFLVLGNTLSVIDPIDFIKILRRLLHPRDRLLADAEVFSPRKTMAGYDNPVNRKFAFAPLASIGLEEGRDGTLVFECQDGHREGLHLVAKEFRPLRPLRVPIAGNWLEFQPGERVRMNASSKYSPGLFQRLMREVGGFQLLREYFSDDKDFLMVLAGPGTR
jgi:L-histidine Nalpha-methyltransferase